jgi:putative membrane protein
MNMTQKTSNELAQVRTDLAVSRSLMAADRTLMAWVRTSLSMISFGFTIYKLLQGFAQKGGGLLPSEGTPRNIGLFLTGMGTLAMVMGTVEYWALLRELREVEPFRIARPALVMALVMSATGVVSFFGIVMRLL